MHQGPVLLFAFLALAFGTARDQVRAEPPNNEFHQIRYGVRADLDRFPQDTPAATIRSVIQAAQLGENTYLLAHLVDPREVDVQTGGNLNGLRQLASRISPERRETLIEALLEFSNGGMWRATRQLAVGEVVGRPPMRLQKIGSRWYLINASEPSE